MLMVSLPQILTGSRSRLAHRLVAVTDSLRSTVTVAAVAPVVSLAAVAAGAWASGAAALEPSLRVTSLRDFGVSRDPSSVGIVARFVR